MQRIQNLEKNSPVVKKFKKSLRSCKSRNKSKMKSKKTSKDIKCRLEQELEDDFQPLYEEYDVIQYIGKGSYGVVAKAIHRKTNQIVAIKKYHHLYRDQIDSKRILREIAILRQLNHPNIVKLYDIIIPDTKVVDKIYLVMEYCDVDLKSLIYKPGPTLSPNQIKKLMFDILNGLDYIHRCGVLHRDLKPANIVVCLRECQAKICDFGLARDMTLEFDTDLLLNIFFSEESTNKPLQGGYTYDQIRKCLLSETDLDSNMQIVLRDNLDLISEKLFNHLSKCKFNQSQSPNLSNFEAQIQPKNLLYELEEKNLCEFSDEKESYYDTYIHLLEKDMKLRKELTPHVITRWYRAPEVILYERIYTAAVDVWSVGCIFGEILGKLQGNTPKGPMFPGSSSYPLSPYVITTEDNTTITELANDDQLLMILKLMGTPNEEEYSFISNPQALEYIKNFPIFPGTDLMTLYPACDKEMINLLSSMLRFDPRNRISVKDALMSNYFASLKEYINKWKIETYTNTIKETLIVNTFDQDSFKPTFSELKEHFLEEYNSFQMQKLEDKMSSGMKIQKEVDAPELSQHSTRSRYAGK